MAEKMKAAQIKEYGHADAVEVVEVDRPTAGQGQVLVEVQAASLNPFDTMVREGYLKDAVPLKLPVTLGGDIAGVNVETNEIVYGQANVVAGNSGALAEYAVTKAEQLAKAPVGIDITEAAALPLVGVSALQALNDHLELQPDEKIFIHGGAGAIGSIAVQVAKAIGAYVAVTATGEGADYARELGADEVIDYKVDDFSQKLSDFDKVFDTVGGEDFTKSFGILKSGGRAVSMIAEVDDEAAQEHKITAIRQTTHVITEKLNELTKLVEAGKVRTKVGKVFTLSDIQQAFEARESGEVLGKIVVHL